MPASPPAAPFAEVLRSLRVRAGLTQEELAERAGLTPHAISALERGARTRPYPHTVRALAAALGLSEAEQVELRAAVPRRRSNAAADDPAPSVPSGPHLAPLPVPPTALLGRDREAAALTEQLRDGSTRLVTLTGVGGVGKSRLAIEVAGRAAPGFPDGVAWVPLAAVTDPSLVVPAIGRAVGLSGVEGLDAAVVVAGALRTARVLLIVDNLEHLLDAVIGLGELLGTCPGVVVLATSRAALRLRGEHEHPVRPLAVPKRSAGAQAVAASPAGALFAERARAVAPAFTVDAGNAADIALLCARLAGIPLALELAAARARLLSPAMLLTRLDAAMASGGARDLPSRQRTLAATLDGPSSNCSCPGSPSPRATERPSAPDDHSTGVLPQGDSMRLLHLSDLHIPRDSGPDAEGVDARAVLARLLHDCRHLTDLDLVVVTGDVADDGSPEGYADALALVAPYARHRGAAQAWCVGNHDARDAFSAVLGTGHLDPSGNDTGRAAPAAAGVCAAASETGGVRVVTLDSLIPGEVPGRIGSEQLEWLRDVLSEPAPAGTVLAFHHPPISVSPQWSAASLQNPSALADVLDGSDVRAVLCGHVHAQVSGFLAGVPVWVGPGVATRIDLTAPRGVVRAVRGAAATVVDLGDLHGPLFHVVHAREPNAGEQVYLADGTTWQYIDDEEPERRDFAAPST